MPSVASHDGHGDPDTSIDYRNAVEALFALSWTMRFAPTRAGVLDYEVMPLEGLCWTPRHGRLLHRRQVVLGLDRAGLATGRGRRRLARRGPRCGREEGASSRPGR